MGLFDLFSSKSSSSSSTSSSTVASDNGGIAIGTSAHAVFTQPGAVVASDGGVINQAGLNETEFDALLNFLGGANKEGTTGVSPRDAMAAPFTGTDVTGALTSHIQAASPTTLIAWGAALALVIFLVKK